MKRQFTWIELDLAIDNIVNQLRIKKIKVDKVLGIPRGGLIPAVILSHKLNIPLYFRGETNLKPHDVLLIIDDISDTGHTMKQYYNIFYSPGNIITASIHLRPGSLFVPDIYYEETSDWIVYPFETTETSKADYIGE
jgi:hypoxanthine phosphoribosyltransferase